MGVEWELVPPLHLSHSLICSSTDHHWGSGHILSFSFSPAAPHPRKVLQGGKEGSHPRPDPLLPHPFLPPKEVNSGTAFRFSHFRDYRLTGETSKHLPVTVQIPHLAFNTPPLTLISRSPFLSASLVSSLSPKYTKLGAISVLLLLLFPLPGMPSLLLSCGPTVLTYLLKTS